MTVRHKTTRAAYEVVAELPDAYIGYLPQAGVATPMLVYIEKDEVSKPKTHEVVKLG